MFKFLCLLFISNFGGQSLGRSLETKMTVQEMRALAAKCCWQRYDADPVADAGRRCATACVEVFNYYGRRSINYRKYRKILNDDCGRHGYDHQLDPCLNGEEQFNWETKSTTIASSSGLENRQNHLSIFRTLIKIFGIEWPRFFGVRQR